MTLRSAILGAFGAVPRSEIASLRDRMDSEGRALRGQIDSLKRSRSWNIAELNRLTAQMHRNASTKFANDVWSLQGPTVRNIARHLIRNHSMAATYVDFATAKILGKDGIWPRFATKDKAINALLTDLWWQWSCFVDSRGEESWNGIQEIEVREFAATGEAFCAMGTGASIDGAMPLTLDTFESEQLSGIGGPSVNVGKNQYISNGIVYDENGRKVKYLVDVHNASGAISFEQREIAAADVTHAYLRKRPTQARGESVIDTTGQALFDLDEIDNAERQLIKTASFLGVWLQTTPMVNPNDPLDGLGVAQGDSEDTGDPDGEDTDADRYSKMRLVPGMVSGGPETPHVMDVRRPSGEYQAFSTAIRRLIAARFNVPYGAFDSTGLNYSGMRGEEMQTRPRWDRMSTLLIAKSFRPKVRRFLKLAAMMGYIQPKAVAEIERYVLWPLPRREWVDVEAEAKRREATLNMGLTDWMSEVMAEGNDPEDVCRGIAEGRELAAQYGVTVPEPGYLNKAAKPANPADPNADDQMDAEDAPSDPPSNDPNTTEDDEDANA